jgi:hypothetical protein
MRMYEMDAGIDWFHLIPSRIKQAGAELCQAQFKLGLAKPEMDS